MDEKHSIDDYLSFLSAHAFNAVRLPLAASLIASNPVLPTLCGEYANAASRRACTYPHSAYTMRIDRPLLTERMTYACPVHATGTRDGGCSLRSTT